MKVLFLDFDGVLGPCYFKPRARHECFPEAGLHQGCQDQIRRVIDVTGCKVVVSSDWRTSHSLEELRALLLDAGVVPSLDTVVGMTPVLPRGGPRRKDNQPRGAEIDAWLSAYDFDPAYDSFAIVDDIVDACMVPDFKSGEWFRDHELGPRFVQTMWEHGCTRADADALIALLGAANG